jgi:hypothetical protein
LSHDVLALAGAALATRQVLFDFIVDELARREPEDPRRIRPVRVALQNQRDELLGFAGVLDAKLIAIAHSHEISITIVREACTLHRLPTINQSISMFIFRRHIEAMAFERRNIFYPGSFADSASKRRLCL